MATHSRAAGAWWRGFPVAVAAGLAHGAIVVASFAPLGWSAATLLTALPLMVVADRWRGRWWVLALGVWVGALPAWLYETHWVIEVSAAGYWPFAGIMAGFVALYVALLVGARRGLGWAPMVAAGPVLWVGVEFLRGEVFFTGYAMTLSAQPLIDAGVLGGATGLAWVLGTYGVGLVAALPAAGVVDLVSRRRVAGGVGIAAFGVVTGVGLVVPRPVPGARVLRVAVVQTDVAQSNKVGWAVEDRLSDFARFAALTREAAAGGPDVIAWPETMFPGMALDEDAVARERAEGLSWRVDGERVATTSFHDALMALQREVGVPLIVGAIGLEGFGFEEVGDGVMARFDRQFNSAFLIEGGRVRGARYDKMVLTPFGEVMPYISAWPWLERRLLAIGASGMSFELSRGSGAVRFQIPTAEGDVAVATPICFEATEASQCRRLVGGGGGRQAGVLINLTNDGWFGGFDGGRAQHLLAARWRCLELRTPMVRAANTGISAAIGADGEVLSGAGGPLRLDPRTDGVLIADVPVGEGAVPGGVVGRVVAWACLVSLVAPVGAGIRARTRGRAGSKNGLKGGSA